MTRFGPALQSTKTCKTLTMREGDVMILLFGHMLTAVRPAEDFDNVFTRMADPHTHFHGNEMMAAVQMTFIDFYEFNARIYGEPDISAITAGVMRKFIDLLEQGEYRKELRSESLCRHSLHHAEIS